MNKREWKTIREFEEILFEEYNGIAKITINRPRYRNAFTPRQRGSCPKHSRCAGKCRT